MLVLIPTVCSGVLMASNPRRCAVMWFWSMSRLMLLMDVGALLPYVGVFVAEYWIVVGISKGPSASSKMCAWPSGVVNATTERVVPKSMPRGALLLGEDSPTIVSFDFFCIFFYSEKVADLCCVV